MKTLVIAPHPDDEVLGCGGMIAKRASKGEEVYVCIVCEGKIPDYTEYFIKKEARESYEANALLGVTKMINLELRATALDMIPQAKINDLLTEVVKNVQPDEVFIPHRGDIHKDHQIVADAAMVAVRPKNGCNRIKVAAYEVMSETGWNVPTSSNAFIPDMYVDVTNTLAVKLEAMRAYRSQLQNAPEARSIHAMQGLAMYRGAMIGVRYAEAFSIIREVE